MDEKELVDQFDWINAEEEGEGGHDSEGDIESESVETETIESANSESEDTQEQSSTIEEQEANTNTVNETEAEQEDYGTPVDLSWISTSDLSEKEKNDAQISSDADLASGTSETSTEQKTKSDNKVEAAKEENSQYPNGMTKEEFNAMYEFALGMTGKSADRSVDDNGNPTGSWGAFTELPTTIEELKEEVNTLEKWNKEGKEGYESLLESTKSELAAAEEQYNVLNDFIENYQSLYSSSDSESLLGNQQLALQQTYDEKTAELEQAYITRSEAWGNLTRALEKAGMDSNLSAEEILSSSTSNFELSKEDKNYASKAADAIVKTLSQKDFKGGTFDLPVNTSAKEYGSYSVLVGKGDRTIGSNSFNIAITSPKGDTIAKGTITLPSWSGNGEWDIKDGAGNTISKGESSSAFARSVAKALSEAAISDYESSNATSSIPDDVINAARAVIAADNNVEKLDKEIEKLDKEISQSAHNAATETTRDILDKYTRGEINAYQAAVALTKVEDSMLDTNYNSIESAINIDKDFGTIAGNTGRGTVGVNSLVSDLSPVTPDNPASTSNISKGITSDFKNMNELKEALSKVDTATATNLQSFNDLKTQVENINVQLDQLASSAFLDLAKELLGKGISLAELDNQPEMQQLNNEIYALAQMVLDKASELKEISGQYGLNDLTMKELKHNREAYSEQVALITGKNGVTLLDKSDMKALVDYSKSLDATIDSAKALMTAAAVLHGAKDVKGGKYAEAWKAEQAEQKLTAKEWLATAATSTLSLLATIVGFAMIPANPIVGGALAFAGTKSLVEKTGKTVGKVTTSHLTNYERMFGSEENPVSSIIAKVYDIGFNKANYGDIKSVGTYTTIADSTIDILNAMAMLTNPVTAIAGLGYIYDAGKSMTVDLAQGSYEGKKNNLITNVWRLVDNIEEWADTNLGAQELLDLINAGETVEVVETDEREGREGRVASSDYGTTSGETADNADKTYSGASEQAKNANLAQDYNAGMEKNVNEAVSDKYVKVFKVMLDKEPDYIRKVLIAIPKNHSETEW